MDTLIDRDRFLLLGTPAEATQEVFAEMVAKGLQPEEKSLPCRFLYDARGSELFEKICTLPEYYPTRCEAEILEERSGEIAKLFVGRSDHEVELVELGSGSATKTSHLIEALIAEQESLRFIPIDISASILKESSPALLERYPSLEIHAIAAEYQKGLAELSLEHERSRLVIWLGSNVGNLTREEALEFLKGLRASFAPEDRFLVGVDLRKDRVTLEMAYDDPAGVTADFNKNLLRRINAELGGNFDLEAFRHRAIWNPTEGRMEMYLESRRDQEARIESLDLELTFRAGERIHTEYSYKYTKLEIEKLVSAAGFQLSKHWTDKKGRFSLNLLRPAAS